MISSILDKVLSCDGISIDSRTIRPNECFIALRGDSHNGNQYVKDALEKGAAHALVDDPSNCISDACLMVDDTLKALQSMAQMYRQQIEGCTVIGVAGSNGKTTTKELIYLVLSQAYEGCRSYRNYNNHIGVPLSILNIKPNHSFAVIELGANHPGEHHRLCQISQPNLAIVTNCGLDHLEGYGSVEGVIQSNTEVYDYIQSTHGRLLVNGSDSLLMSKSEGISRIIYGKHSDSIIVARKTQSYPYICAHFKSSRSSFDISSQLYGDFHLHNMCAAACMGTHFGISDVLIQAAIQGYKPDNNRSERISWKGNDVFLDAYNANPTSMMAMLDYFDQHPSKNKVIILAGMRELGAASNQEHNRVVDRLRSIICNQILLVGHEFGKVCGLPNCTQFTNTAELIDHLTRCPFTKQTVLVKGSRGYALEAIFRCKSH